MAWLKPIFIYGPKRNSLSLSYPSISPLNSSSVSMASVTAIATLCNFTGNPWKAIHFPVRSRSIYFPKLNFASLSKFSGVGWKAVRLNKPRRGFSCNCFSTISTNTTHYEFYDGSSEVELRLQLGVQDVQVSKDIFVDADGTSLRVRIKQSGSLITLIETNSLFDKIKPAETIWYIDDDQLVINLKKQDPDLKWPDIVESWESLAAGSMQLLKGASIYIVGDSTEINQKLAGELAVGLGYTPLDTKELLESFAKQTIDAWVLAEGSDSVAEAESAVLESLSSHVRAVVATLGGPYGAAARPNNWRHLYSGFTVWLSQTEAIDEDSAKEEARKHIQDSSLGYSNAEVVVKLQGWDADHAKSVAQASLSALKRLILSDKNLPGKKSLYIRLGCRGDWPDIKPPGYYPSTDTDSPPGVL